MGDSKHASTRGMVCFVECKQGTLCRQESAWTLTQMHLRSRVLMLACTSCAYARVACTRACVCWCKCACRHWHATHSPSAQDPAHKLLDVLVSPGLVDVMQNEDNLIFQGMPFFQIEVAYFCCGYLAPMLPKSATRTT